MLKLLVSFIKCFCVNRKKKTSTLVDIWDLPIEVQKYFKMKE